MKCQQARMDFASYKTHSGISVPIKVPCWQIRGPLFERSHFSEETRPLTGLD